MQLLQPKVRELQKKYGHDREKLGQETMKLYKENNANPLASCLPLLLQMPIFLALFRVLDGAAERHRPRPLAGASTPSCVDSLQNATIFGARISDTFMKAGFARRHQQHPHRHGVLILAMTATLFITQLQLMRKNMPPEALTGPFAQQQKMMLYLFPIIFAVGGINFPVGVLIYWFTSNLWTMGQQFYVIRRNPAPGTPAYDAWEERRKAKAAHKHRAIPSRLTRADRRPASGAAQRRERIAARPRQRGRRGERQPRPTPPPRSSGSNPASRPALSARPEPRPHEHSRARLGAVAAPRAAGVDRHTITSLGATPEGGPPMSDHDERPQAVASEPEQDPGRD